MVKVFKQFSSTEENKSIRNRELHAYVRPSPHRQLSGPSGNLFYKKKIPNNVQLHIQYVRKFQNNGN